MTNYVGDTFMGPGMSSFTEAHLPDLSAISAEQGFWVGNYVLNTVFRAQLPKPARRHAYNFLRRVESAFEHYAHARERTMTHLSNPDSRLPYVAAVGHWEDFLASAWQAFCFLERIGGKKSSWYVTGDGSIYERLNIAYNHTKHTDDEEGSPLLPVWLTNDGLSCAVCSLTFLEVEEILRGLAAGADLIQDPVAFSAHVASLAASAEASAE